MIYKTYNNKTYNVYTVKTNKFKTCHMEIVFRNNIDKNNITKRILLTELLTETNKLYNTRKNMSKYLEELYNSSFYATTNRVGSSVLTSFIFEFINPNLVDEKIDEFIKFPLETILNPNIENNEFDNKTFNYIKERIKSDIESIIENPTSYTINKLLNIMCDNTPSSININGYIEQLNNITPENIYQYYLDMLKHDYIDIYIIGDINMNNVNNIIKKEFNINILKNHQINYQVNNTIKKENKKTIIEKYTQEQICIGFNIDNPTEYESLYVANIYNIILGGSSLDSKLYNKLRNESSLCYNCRSIYQRFDSLILIHTAIDKKNENKTIKLIKECIKDMKKENITDEELNNAKKYLTTNLNMSYDTPNRIIDNIIFKNYYNLEDLNTRIEKYNNVTKKEISTFAKKIKINTILCIIDGDENETNKNKEN